MMDLFELTKALVNIPSVTGHEEKIADFIWEYLERQGYKVREQTVSPGRRNILATTGFAPRVILCTHMDTVPPYFCAGEDDVFVYGRGACDAKGIMASMIQAASGLKDKGEARFGLLFVVGEETDSAGAQAANMLNIESEYIVVGEPSENKMGKGHKGIINLKLTAKGKAAHSAFPNLGESAVEKLIDVLQRIRGLDFGEDRIMGKSTLNIGMIEGGDAPNIIPGSADAVISVRSARPSWEILDKIKKAVGHEAGMEVLAQSDPQLLHTLPGFEQVILPYGTDIPHLKNFGKPLLLGPGSVMDAHTSEERVEKRQLSKAVGLYKKIVRKLLSDE